MTFSVQLVGALTVALTTAAMVFGERHDRLPAEALLVVLPLTFPVVATALGRVEILAAGFSSWGSAGFSFAWLAATETAKENPPWMIFALTSIVALMFSALPAAAGIAVAFAARRLLSKRGAPEIESAIAEHRLDGSEGSSESAIGGLLTPEIPDVNCYEPRCVRPVCRQ